MDYTNFLEWLKIEKGMSDRSARDVVCRLKRAVKYAELTQIDQTSISKLEKSPDFNNCSFNIRPQLKRSITLYLDFKK